MPRLAFTLLALVLALGAATEASAQSGAPASGDFGLGLILGDPTGVSGKHMIADEHAIDWAVGFGVIGGRGLHVHADYLWQLPIKRWDAVALDLTLGVGPKLGVHDGGRRSSSDLWLGARGPVGVAIAFLEAPFDVFVEVAAGLWLIEDVDFDLDAAIGGRYWFK